MVNRPKDGDREKMPERGKDEVSCSICVGNLGLCDEFAMEEKIHDPREYMFRYS